jgi:hypothetical protein
MRRNMRAADARPADMRRLGGTHTVPAVPAATTPAAAPGVCLECKKRHDEDQHRRNASAGC